MMQRYKYFVVGFFIILSSLDIVAKIDVKAMIEGMGQNFGVPPKGYVFNFEVWNDTSMPIHVELEKLVSFMGAYFQANGDKAFYGNKVIPSIIDAQGAVVPAVYRGEPYYFNMYISADSPAHKNPIYKKFLTQLPVEKHDPKIYYYHVYTHRNFSQGNFVYDPKVEFIGYQDPSQTDKDKKGSVVFGPQLSNLNFFNSSGFDTKVSLTYNNIPYTFTVEKYSHASLGLPTLPAKKSNKVSMNDELQVALTQENNAVVQTKKHDQTQSEVVIQAIPSGLNNMNKASQQTGSVDALAQKAQANAQVVKNLSGKEDEQDDVKPLFSLRPNNITFTVHAASQKEEKFQTLILPDKGFEGQPYTIEIYQQQDQKMKVGIQGFMPGNYDIASTSRARDVTPCPCYFWYQSVAQISRAAQNGYIDLPGQVWVVYAGGDNPVQAKITPGQVVSWNLTRPLISQGDQFVYFVYVATTDDAIAAKFVTKLSQQLIGTDVIAQYNQAIQTPFVATAATKQGLDVSDDGKQVTQDSLTAEQQIAVLMGNLGSSNGAIEDTELGVIGYLVGTDVFIPKGLGFGRFYYSLAPSLLSTSSLSSLFGLYLDAAKMNSIGQDGLAALVKSWIIEYIKDPVGVKNKVEQYLLQNGNSKVVDSSSKTLTKFGQSCLKTIVSGKLSLKYPSLKLSTVTNHYVFDFGKSAPENMPDKITQL